jgi:hypothetical protein
MNNQKSVELDRLSKGQIEMDTYYVENVVTPDRKKAVRGVRNLVLGK